MVENSVAACVHCTRRDIPAYFATLTHDQESDVAGIIRAWIERQGGDVRAFAVRVGGHGSTACAFALGDALGAPMEIRTLCASDRPLLERFGASLGVRSRDLFAPYPWDDLVRLSPALETAVAHAVAGRDLAFLILRDGEPIGHFFLWGAGGNAHALAHGVDVPELGIAIADRYHGCGLGFLAVRILQEIAAGMGKDAIELTTALENDAGWSMYQRAGFVYTGMIRNPLDVDVVAAARGDALPTRFREERQLIYVIRAERRRAIEAYLAHKREQFASL